MAKKAPFQSKPRLALFLPSLEGGGVRRVMVNLARGFSAAGTTVDMVLARAKGSYLAQLPPAVRVIDLHTDRVAHALPGLARYLRRERPAALLTAMEHAGLVALGARRLSGVAVRVVVSAHTIYSQETRHFPHRRNRFLVPFLVRRLYPRAGAIVAVSNGVAGDLARAAGLPRERIRVIPNPVITPELLVQMREPLEHPWFAPGEPPVVLSVGRLTAEKDFPLLLEAFVLLRRGGRRARLIMLGEGPERAKLEALIARSGLVAEIALPGFVANPYPYLVRAAVVALSSRWEGFGNVLVEALAAGAPVVSTDCPSGPAEILDGGRYGRLTPVGDAAALAAALSDTLDAPPEPALLRQRSRDFTLERILPLYREVLFH